MDGLTKVIAADGRIHTSFQNTVTATGRLSSTEPNLQNIPVRTELGAELRKMFVAPAGRVLVDATTPRLNCACWPTLRGRAHDCRLPHRGGYPHRHRLQVFGVPPDR